MGIIMYTTHIIKTSDKLDNTEIITSIIQMLNDTNIHVQSRAIQVLGNIKAKEAVEPLISQLREPEYSNKKLIVEALNKIGTDAARNAVFQWEKKGKKR
jgi:HEAT repeat protein